MKKTKEVGAAKYRSHYNCLDLCHCILHCSLRLKAPYSCIQKENPPLSMPSEVSLNEVIWWEGSGIEKGLKPLQDISLTFDTPEMISVLFFVGVLRATLHADSVSCRIAVSATGSRPLERRLLSEQQKHRCVNQYFTIRVWNTLAKSREFH